MKENRNLIFDKYFESPRKLLFTLNLSVWNCLCVIFPNNVFLQMIKINTNKWKTHLAFWPSYTECQVSILFVEVCLKKTRLNFKNVMLMVMLCYCKSLFLITKYKNNWSTVDLVFSNQNLVYRIVSWQSNPNVILFLYKLTFLWVL